MACRHAHGSSRARYGLRGLRIGEAAHPGPAAEGSGPSGPHEPAAQRRRILAAGMSRQVADDKSAQRGHGDMETQPASDSAVAAMHQVHVAQDGGSVTAPVPPAPLASDVAAASGPRIPAPANFRCPLCAAFSGRGSATVHTHISMAHAGTVLTEAACTVLNGWGRKVCTSDGCGALRRADRTQCRRCFRSAPFRPVVAGDRIPPLRRSAQDGSQMEDAGPDVASASAPATAEPSFRPQTPIEAEVGVLCRTTSPDVSGRCHAQPRKEFFSQSARGSATSLPL